MIWTLLIFLPSNVNSSHQEAFVLVDLQDEIFMGRNRKFVLEDDRRQAVWRTILRGPRPPSVQWNRMRNPASAASKPNHPKPEPQKKNQKVPVSRPPVPRREAVSPDQATSAARQRVVKLEAILATLGEEDEIYPTLLAALKKAQSKSQERSVSDRISSTKSFLLRSQKRVEQARQVAVKAREALAEVIVSGEG